ncbi:unnamed protein product [Auanema sp. JU1783]|nr:unnamed protein product [Auanema sp. JU1783]
MIKLLFLFQFFLFTDGVVQLKKRILQDNIEVIRIQNYTDEILPSRSREKQLSLNILLVADFSLYNSFLDISRGDKHSASIRTEEYLTAIFEQVKIIYNNNVIAGQKLQLKLIQTLVTFRSDDCPMNEVPSVLNKTDYFPSNLTLQEELYSMDVSRSISAELALDKISFWLQRHKSILRPNDHAFFITKLDLYTEHAGSATQGMAYVGHICKIDESLSLVEDVGGTATALIAAHELAHSLGAFHDDSHNDTINCAASHNYMMSSRVSGTDNDILFANSRKLSRCSVESIENVIRTPQAKCVWKSGDELNSTNPKLDEFDVMPGEKIPLYLQCQIAFGPHFGLCPNKEYFRGISVCQRLWCKNRNEKRSAPCVTLAYLPALDGTECARNRWCINGGCVFNQKKLLDCRDLNAKTCSRYSKVKLRHYCKSKDFTEICCSSCAKLKELSLKL